ncbi:MAG: hypothetical protein FJW23_05565 [Acidimicrobiia bacterium]|nr:hypothetical protein [Acidimicrobiia bacterium]
MRLPRLPPAVALGTLLLLGNLSGQDGASGRATLSDISAGPIDRGIRDADPPTAPRSAATRIARRDRGGHLEGSLIVKFAPGASGAARARALSGAGAAVTATPSHADFEIVAIDPAADHEAAAALLAGQPEVEYAQPRYRVHTMLVPNDPLFPRQWNLSALGMERAWDIAPGASSSVVVAVVDSGVAYRGGLVRFNGVAAGGFPALGPVDVPFAAAPDLGGSERIVTPFDFIWNDPVPLDLDGHGTHIAGTIGQATNNGLGVAGIAYNVRLMPVKVIDGEWDVIFNSPFFGTDDVVARGIRYAADNGAEIVNLSIGREGGPAPAVRAAIEYAVSRGALVVAAGGNEGNRGNAANRLADFAREIDGMVAVGATGPTGARAFYSNTASYIEVAAPGGDMRFGTTGGILQQTYDRDVVDRFSSGVARFGPPRFDMFVYGYFQGSSMASAHVSGVAALLIQHGITRPAALEAALKQFATDLGPAGRDNEFGFGLIAPRNALRGMGLFR